MAHHASKAGPAPRGEGAGRYRYPHPRPAVTVDIVILTLTPADLEVLLIRRKNPPFRDSWAIPGGFVEMEESLEAAALRELREETGVKDIYLEQLYTFGEPRRDPRTRVVTVAYYALTPKDRVSFRRGSDAREVRWFSMYRLPPLAFDHARILETALARLRAKIEYTPAAFELLPRIFTLSELQRVYEIILHRPVDKRNFRRKFLAYGILIPERGARREGSHRPARLYSFSPGKFAERRDKGIAFSF